MVFYTLGDCPAYTALHTLPDYMSTSSNQADDLKIRTLPGGNPEPQSPNYTTQEPSRQNPTAMHRTALSNSESFMSIAFVVWWRGYRFGLTRSSAIVGSSRRALRQRPTLQATEPKPEKPRVAGHGQPLRANRDTSSAACCMTVHIHMGQVPHFSAGSI